MALLAVLAVVYVALPLGIGIFLGTLTAPAFKEGLANGGENPEVRDACGNEMDRIRYSVGGVAASRSGNY